jgi:1-acyl-sn-glycerol-3-phosphate acyltransferase
LRLILQGAEHLPMEADGSPAGGWIAAGFPHRTWIDPFVLAVLLPIEPRLVFLGDGRAIFRSRFRRLVFGRLGGVVPIWPGGGRDAVEAHIAAARSVVDAGAVFVLMPEAGRPVPVDQARPFGTGLGYFALRTGAPMVPLVLGGAHELFWGRRIVLRVLPPVTARSLLGRSPDAALPEPWAPEERAAAHRIVEELHRRTVADVAECHRLAEPRAGARKPLRWLTGLFH